MPQSGEAWKCNKCGSFDGTLIVDKHIFICKNCHLVQSPTKINFFDHSKELNEQEKNRGVNQELIDKIKLHDKERKVL